MSTKTEVFHRAIHWRVLVVYVATTPTGTSAGDWAGDWAAYVLPVPGQNHAAEVAAWQRDGSKLQEDEARALWPAMAADFDRAGIKWRP